MSDDATEDIGALLEATPPALLTKLLISSGRSEYHAGVFPAWKSLAREEATAGSVMDARREGGMAVRSTEIIDRSGVAMLALEINKVSCEWHAWMRIA